MAYMSHKSGHDSYSVFIFSKPFTTVDILVKMKIRQLRASAALFLTLLYGVKWTCNLDETQSSAHVAHSTSFGSRYTSGLMIREENELLRQKVTSPIEKRLNHHVEFLVVGGVPLSDIIQLLTEVSNWMIFLSEDSAYSNSWCVTRHFKDFKKIERHMIEALTILFLISTNAFATAQNQLNSPFFKQSVIGAMIVLNPLMNRR